MRVLIAEHDRTVSHWLSNSLHGRGHDCRVVEEGKSAWQVLSQEACDVIVLEQDLPVVNGIDLLLRLQDRIEPPVLMIASSNATGGCIEALRAGAQDYLTKPFEFDELLLRLERLVQRFQPPMHLHRLEVADLQIDLKNREVSRSGKRIVLTDKEFNLLRVLVENRGRAVSRAMLLEKVWGYSFDPQTNVIDVHLSKLRQKIDRDFDHRLLRTIRAVGYVIG